MERDRFFIETDSGGRWIFIRQGTPQPLRSVTSKRETVPYGRKAARKKGRSRPARRPA